MPSLTMAKVGRLSIEWPDKVTIRIVREDNMQTVELSISEWNVIVRLVEIHGWPVCPPSEVTEG